MVEMYVDDLITFYIITIAATLISWPRLVVTTETLVHLGFYHINKTN